MNVERLPLCCCQAVVLFAATAYAAPTADADPQLLHAGLGYGLFGAAHVAAPAVAAVHAAPAVATVAAAPVAAVHAAPVATVAAAPAVAAVHAAPVAAVHAAPVAVATAPVVHQVGYQVHHTVQHVPQVHVQKHVTHHTTQHVINHAPVVGAYTGLAPVAVAAAPAVAVAESSE